jgi:gliding motility-associated lipoprotein GldH
MKISTLLLSLIGLLLFGCDSPYFNERAEVANDVWTYEDTKFFTFSAPDTQNLYDIALEVEYQTDYSYQNVYIELETLFPDGDTLTQSFSMDLADKFGNWLGDCSGDLCSKKALLQPQTRFEQSGTYHLNFRQFTRKDSLMGIHALELSIQPAGEKEL